MQKEQAPDPLEQHKPYDATSLVTLQQCRDVISFCEYDGNRNHDALASHALLSHTEILASQVTDHWLVAGVQHVSFLCYDGRIRAAEIPF